MDFLRIGRIVSCRLNTCFKKDSFPIFENCLCTQQNGKKAPETGRWPPLKISKSKFSEISISANLRKIQIFWNMNWNKPGPEWRMKKGFRIFVPKVVFLFLCFYLLSIYPCIRIMRTKLWWIWEWCSCEDMKGTQWMPGKGELRGNRWHFLHLTLLLPTFPSFSSEFGYWRSKS